MVQSASGADSEFGVPEMENNQQEAPRNECGGNEVDNDRDPQEIVLREEPEVQDILKDMLYYNINYMEVDYDYPDPPSVDLRDYLLEEVRCDEVLPLSDDKENKENSKQRSKSPVSTRIEFDPKNYVVVGEVNSLDYDRSDLIPLPELLKIHCKQMVSGFEFGEATQRRAQENMKSARDKTMEENRKSGEIGLTTAMEQALIEMDVIDKPCCSKTLSEQNHKTPHSHKRKRSSECRMNPQEDKDFCGSNRGVPNSLLGHPDCIEVWFFMVYKEEAGLELRNARLFNDFKSVTPRMRAILLDWLMEVAEVYHLRRVTYYLSLDYFDRFLSIRPDIPKSLLQLVGITCLYLAAKVEEIYPPNLKEFSYVCDGACKAEDIVSCELLILNSLGWEVALTTPSDWLNLYMQLHYKNQEVVGSGLSRDFNKDFVFPQYSAYEFTTASHLMDLLSLDSGFLKFSYSIIAAAAMFYTYGKEIALNVSGLTWEQLRPCAEYMYAFYKVLEDANDPRLESILGRPHPEEANKPSSLAKLKDLANNENYSFQIHVASMDYFEQATVYRYQILTGQKSHTEEFLNLEKLHCDKSSELPKEEMTVSDILLALQ